MGGGGGRETKGKKGRKTNRYRKFSNRESTRYAGKVVFVHSILGVAGSCRLTIRQLCTVRTLCTLIKKKTKFSSYMRKIKWDRLVIYEEGLHA